MLFNSYQFLFFFPIVVAAYFAIAQRYRWILLLICSYYFYMCWRPEYILLILVSTVIDYWAGIQMSKAESKQQKRPYLYLSLVANLGILFFFKYFNFFNESIRAGFDAVNVFYDVPAFDFLLPVGISFYTFQTLSYTIDVYNGHTKPEKHFGIFALYVSFFPQLVAGPIERSSHLLPQFRRAVSFDYTRIRNGILMMCWGFFKKMVIADRVAEYVNKVYNHPQDYDGWANIIATYFFAIQIYCDFSGYSDIAIGAAFIMGYELMTNFKRPYFSQSVREFWGRWHISLSTWFRDYCYIPLGGNRVVKWRWYYNLLITFLVSGLWHGASWTFVIWGFLHGAFLVLALLCSRWLLKSESLIGLTRQPALRAGINVFVTFHLAVLAWVFFRANSVQDAFLILENSLTFSTASLNLFSNPVDLWVALAAIAVLLLVDLVHERVNIMKWLWKMPVGVRWALFIGLLVSMFVFARIEDQDFLYFQF